jgi:hypothetical protein
MSPQYQVSDDLAWQKGNHNAKFGVNFRRNDLTDYTPGGFNATIPTAIFNAESSFFNGTVDVFQQAFATRPTEPLAVYSLGLYAQDEWAVRRRLKVTLSLRAEHNSDPVCQTNCFARLTNSFLSISHDPLQPYNKAIKTRLHQALPNYEKVGWEPRLGFAWQPFSSGKTVIRGGAGIFADVFPGTVATAFDTNPPTKKHVPCIRRFSPEFAWKCAISGHGFERRFRRRIQFWIKQWPDRSSPSFVQSARHHQRRA